MPIAFVIALFGIGAVFLILLLEIGIVASELLSYGREAIQKNSNQADVIHFDHGMEAKRLGGKIVAESDGRDRISCLNVDRRSVKMLLGYQYFDLPL